MAEEQPIAIEVLDHETSEPTLIRVSERDRKPNATRRELRRQRVRIRDFEISVPTEGRLAAVVRDRIDNDLLAVHDLAERLEHDRCPISADDSEELVVSGWAAERDFKTQHIAIEGQCRRHVCDDKEG